MDEVNLKSSEIRNRQSEMTSSLDMNTHKIHIDVERIEETKALQEGLRKEIESAKDKIEQAKALVEKLNEDLKKAAADRSAKHKQLEENELILSKLTLEIAETENRVNASKMQIVDYFAKETRNKNELIKLGADVQNKRSRQRRLELEKDKVKLDLS